MSTTTTHTPAVIDTPAAPDAATIPTTTTTPTPSEPRTTPVHVPTTTTSHSPSASFSNSSPPVLPPISDVDESTPIFAFDAPTTISNEHSIPQDQPLLTPPEHLEQMFLKVEREAELRAEAEAAAEATATANAKRASLTPSASGSRPGTSQGSAPPTGRRRGGSVSVSRFGAPVDNDGTPGTPSRLSTLVMNNPVYSAQLAVAALASRETIASSLGTAAPDALASNSNTLAEKPEEGNGEEEEEEHTVTQVQHLPGRRRSATLSKAVGAAMAKLSRVASSDALRIDAPVVVGVVVVQSNTEEVATEEKIAHSNETSNGEEEQASGTKSPSPVPPPSPNVMTTTIVAASTQAPPKLKREKSRLSVWAEKITFKFKRKSREDLKSATAIAAAS